MMEEQEIESQLLEAEFIGSERIEEILLAQLTVQMRTYDLLIELINFQDPRIADAIVEQHRAGKTFNPPIFMVPDENSS